MSHGDKESAKLRSNIEDQLNRLLTQLQDLEDMKGDLDAKEYESTKAGIVNVPYNTRPFDPKSLLF